MIIYKEAIIMMEQKKIPPHFVFNIYPFLSVHDDYTPPKCDKLWGGGSFLKSVNGTKFIWPI